MNKLTISLISAALITTTALAQTREEKVRADRAKVEAAGVWIYNDLPRAFAEARASGKPMLVLFRCIPCSECVKLDDDLVNEDAVVKPLLSKFVLVRVVSTNGLDLSLFQFDTDQSSAVFMLNADETIYGRYGTRSHHTAWEDDLSVDGLARALEGALELHAKFPAVKASLAAKRGPVPEFPVPEKFPSLEGKYTDKLNYEGEVVKSCIHCHQVGDAQRRWYRDKPGQFPDEILFQYPHPKSLGLILDPKQRASVVRVEPGTAAAQAGFQKGDVIQTMNGQPLLSIADVQWVLHLVPGGGGPVKATVLRDGKPREIMLALFPGWRQRDDISWRASSWELRRAGLGAMKLDELTAAERKAAKLADDTKALLVKHVGQYAPHDVAKRAGVMKGDILLKFDGKPVERESDLLSYSIRDKQPGDRVDLEILRGGETKTLSITVQK